jgi:FAD/FMN-containing dehydrogenase
MTSSDEPASPARRNLLRAGMAGAALSACSRPGPNAATPTVTDISRLDATSVHAIVRPASTDAVRAALAMHPGPVSIGGAHCSMGGQTAEPGSLHLDMGGANQVLWVDPAAKRARVQAGTAWRDLQERIDPFDLSVAVMQSYSNFSVGGSLSVNCHGRYVGKGPVVNTVRALQLVTADGRAQELSRDQDHDLFRAVVGGYGGLGVITEVELDLADNIRIARQVEQVALKDYPAFFREKVLSDPDALLHNADLAPPGFDAPVCVTWSKTDAPLTESRRLVPRHADYSREQNAIWSITELPGGNQLRGSFASDLYAPVVTWRNHEASLDIASLEPRTRFFSTYLLQEYFIPVRHFLPFATTLAGVLQRFDVNALNVSIRHSPADTESLMAWAREEVFSFVLYYKVRSSASADADAGRWTRALIDAALAAEGRYYLPYRLHATPAQFLRAYPEARAFAALKRQVDPAYRFRNRLWDRYLPAIES